MEELTIKEIAEKLGINPGAVKIRLHRKGIKPLKIVGQTGIYDPAVTEQVCHAARMGRPRKSKPEVVPSSPSPLGIR